MANLGGEEGGWGVEENVRLELSRGRVTRWEVEVKVGKLEDE